MAGEWEVIRAAALNNAELTLAPQAKRVYRSMIKIIDLILTEGLDPQVAIAASKAAEAALKAIVVGITVSEKQANYKTTLTAQKGPSLLPYPSEEDLERAKNGS